MTSIPTHLKTPLLRAAENRHEGARILLERNDVDPETADTVLGLTPLLRAAQEHQGFMMRLLEWKDASPNTPDKTCPTPLQFTPGWA